jgi:hypothetical protein
MSNIAVTNIKKRSVVLFLIFTFILFSNVSYGQKQVVNSLLSNTAEITKGVNQEKNNASNMEFVLWFMGSKQNPNTTISTEGINTKKQIITSGLAPNRLLIKAFLKKAVNYEIAVV